MPRFDTVGYQDFVHNPAHPKASTTKPFYAISFPK
jgi:hypothetical protein